MHFNLVTVQLRISNKHRILRSSAYSDLSVNGTVIIRGWPLSEAWYLEEIWYASGKLWKRQYIICREVVLIVNY